MSKKLLYSCILLLIFLLPGLYLVYIALFPFKPGTFLNIPVSILGFLTGNSILLAITASLFAFIIGLGSAVSIAYFEFPGRKFLEAALCLPLAFPPYVVAAVYREIAHQNYQSGINVENLWGASLIFAFTLYPYFYLLLKTAFLNQSAAYIEAGKSLGLSPGKRLLKIIIPMAKPAIILGLLLISMEIISDYGTVHILGVRTLTVGIYDTWFSMVNPRLAAQLSLIVYAVPMLVLLAFTKTLRNASFHNPPNRPACIVKNDLNIRQAVLPLCITSIPLLAGFIVPLFVLVSWTIEKLEVTNTAALFKDLFYTLSLSVLVAGISMIVSIMLAYLKRKYKSHVLINAAGWIICAQYAVPGIVIGIVLLFLTRGLYTLSITRWLCNSVFLIVFACVIRYFCFAFFSVESGMKRISLHLDEHAHTLGKNKMYLLFHIHLPLIKPSIMAGCILIFINMTKELTMSLVLQPFHYSSLSLRIFSYASMDMLKNSAIYAFVLVLIAIYPVFSLSRWFHLKYTTIGT